MAVVLNMPPSISQAAANPRKRKKRAPAAGAANDCFKCAERNVKCDRRRPYCSQCLELGKDCSGYKTQLTWGIGVASRGKLRGMSLPVTEAQKPDSETLKPPAKKRRDTNVAAPSFLHSTAEKFAPHPNHILRSQPANITLPMTPEVETPSSDTRPSPPMAIWDPTMFSVPHGYQSVPIATTPVSPGSGSESHSSYLASQSHDVTFNRNFWLPMQHVGTPPEADVSHSHISPTNHTSRDHYSSIHQQLDRTAHKGLPSSSPASQGDHFFQMTPTEPHFDGISMLLEADQSMQIPTTRSLEEVDDEIQRINYDDCAVTDEHSSQLMAPYVEFNLPLHSPAGIHHIGKTTRMQYLINYYAEVISPVIVAFDSPSNPFRTQILRLAENSETLQHAISALAASNLRQRRGVGLLSTGKTAPARRSSFAHVHLLTDYEQTSLSPEEQMREEILHKRLAVSQLNQQLAHPVFRKDDSTLATLLILCLFHICDSGIAKFQTQFAGVRKLLTLRGDTQKIGNEDSKWMARLFTCFDALAATVNDREGQIAGRFLDMSALCGDWALENLAGIDAQLFRTISKLGQLNMLKHGKKVEDISSDLDKQPQVFNPASYATLDGNGWYRHDSGVGFGIEDGDNVQQQVFWKKWDGIRTELLAWSLDTTLFDSLSRESSYLTPEQRIDLEHISEAFRYAGLLYTERLAQPNVPSSDESIQHWVRLSLSHIKQVVSDVYLLWPLFITGTECVGEDARDIIRGRCQDIQKDSGFVNNASCLQLLEKVWYPTASVDSPTTVQQTTSPSDHSDSSNGSVFAFRDVMMQEAAKTNGEGEYIVI